MSKSLLPKNNLEYQGNYNEIMNAFNLQDLTSIANTIKSFYAIKDGNFDISQLNEIYEHFEPENFEHRWIYRGLALNINCDDALYVKLANNMDHLAAHDAASKICTKPELLKQVKLHWHESVRSILKQKDQYESLKSKLKSQTITNDEIISILNLNLMVCNSLDPNGGADEYIDQPTILGLTDEFEKDDLSLLPAQFESYEELIDDLNENISDYRLTSTFWHNELLVIASLNKALNTEKFSLDYLNPGYERFIEVGMGSFFFFTEFMSELGPEILWKWFLSEEIYQEEGEKSPASILMNGYPVYGNHVDNWHLICLPFNPSFSDDSRKKVIYDFLKMNLNIHKIDYLLPEALIFLFSISCILSLQDKSLMERLYRHNDPGIRKSVELNPNDRFIESSHFCDSGLCDCCNNDDLCDCLEPIMHPGPYYNKITLSLEGWMHHFRPMTNHLRKNKRVRFDGKMFKTHGEEYEYVVAIGQKEPNRIWTYIDSEDGTKPIVNRLSLSNQIGYFITENLYDESLEIITSSISDQEERDEQDREAEEEE